MKKRKRLSLLFLPVIIFCFAGCADENYMVVNPDVFNYEYYVAANDIIDDSSESNLADYILLPDFTNFLNYEMDQRWDSERLIIPLGRYLIECRKITDSGLIVFSNIMLDVP